MRRLADTFLFLTNIFAACMLGLLELVNYQHRLTFGNDCPVILHEMKPQPHYELLLSGLRIDLSNTDKISYGTFEFHRQGEQERFVHTRRWFLFDIHQELTPELSATYIRLLGQEVFALYDGIIDELPVDEDEQP